MIFIKLLLNTWLLNNNNGLTNKFTAYSKRLGDELKDFAAKIVYVNINLQKRGDENNQVS